MKFKSPVLLIVFLLIMLNLNSYAAEMYILLHDNTQHTINLSDVENINYKNSGTLLHINMSSGTSMDFTLSEIRKITFGNTTGITEHELEIIKSISLHNNYPNPFNPGTTIGYELTEPSRVSISIYDALGRFVKNIENGEQTSGYHSIMWNGKDESGNTVSSGVYFYSLQTDNYKETRQMILLK